MSLGFACLGKADGEGKDEEKREDGDNSLERVEFPLHCGESSLAGGLFVICYACPDWTRDLSQSALRSNKTQTKSVTSRKLLELV